MFLDEAAQEVAQRVVCDFRLAIGLWVECGPELERRPHQESEGFPEIAGEVNVSVRDDVAWDPMKANHLIEEQFGGVSSIRCFGTGYEMRHFAEAIDDHQDGVELSLSAR